MNEPFPGWRALLAWIAFVGAFFGIHTLAFFWWPAIVLVAVFWVSVIVLAFNDTFTVRK